MNAAHVHLLVNHIPILGFGFGAILIVVGLWQRREKGITVAAAAVLLVAALGSLIAVSSGEDAEGLVEGLNGITHERIHEHEERAEVANYAAIVTGLAAIGLLVMALRRSFETPAWAWAILLVLVLITTGLMVWAGDAGGKIHHPETRRGFSITADPITVTRSEDSSSGETSDEAEHEAAHEED